MKGFTFHSTHNKVFPGNHLHRH